MLVSPPFPRVELSLLLRIQQTWIQQPWIQQPHLYQTHFQQPLYSTTIGLYNHLIKLNFVSITHFQQSLGSITQGFNNPWIQQS